MANDRLLDAYNFADGIREEWDHSGVPKPAPIKIHWFSDTDNLKEDDVNDEEASETESIKDEHEEEEEEEEKKGEEEDEDMVEAADMEEFYMWPTMADSIVFRLSDEIAIRKNFMNKVERKVYFGHRKSDDLPVAVVVGEDYERHLRKNGMPREVRIMLRLRGQENVAEILGWAPVGKRHFVLVIRHYQSADMIHCSIDNLYLISKILKSTLTAVKQVHDCKVAHRDVAKYNLLWNPVDEKMIIIDFDNACFHRPEGYFRDVGREKYDAPEKTEMLEKRRELRRKKSKVKRRMKGYTEKAEIYSVGVLLWMMLNQREHSPPQRDMKRFVSNVKRRNDHKKYPELDLLIRLVNPDPTRRISLEDALQHPFITDTEPNPQYQHMREYLLKSLTAERPAPTEDDEDDDESEEVSSSSLASHSSESVRSASNDSESDYDEKEEKKPSAKDPDVPDIDV